MEYETQIIWNGEPVIVTVELDWVEEDGIFVWEVTSVVDYDGEVTFTKADALEVAALLDDETIQNAIAEWVSE